MEKCNLIRLSQNSMIILDDIVTDSMDEYMDSLLDFSKMKEDDLFAEEFM